MPDVEIRRTVVEIVEEARLKLIESVLVVGVDLIQIFLKRVSEIEG